MRIQTLPAGALLACLLASCSSSPVRTETVTVHDPVIVAVPAALTKPVPKPKMVGDDNNALASYVLALKAALDQANAQLLQIAGLKD